MRKAYFTLVATIVILSSCEWGKPPKRENDIFTDTIAYEYKTIKARAADCGNMPDSACTHVKITYPVFEDNASLNDTIAAKLLSMFAYEKPYSSLPEYTSKFIKEYEILKKEDPRSVMFYELDMHADVVLQDSSLVTLETGGYIFQGGAHGASYTGYINWNSEANKNLALGDLLVDGYQDKLIKIAEGIFRKNEQLSDTASLANDYFFKDSKFALNDNFAVTPLGLKFLYNQYEIKPYAAGQTILVIPYAQIKELMRPNTVVSHYVK